MVVLLMSAGAWSLGAMRDSGFFIEAMTSNAAGGNGLRHLSNGIRGPLLLNMGAVAVEKGIAPSAATSSAFKKGGAGLEPVTAEVTFAPDAEVAMSCGAEVPRWVETRMLPMVMHVEESEVIEACER